MGFTSSVVYGRVYRKIPQCVKIAVSTIASSHKIAHNSKIKWASIVKFCRDVRTNIIMQKNTKIFLPTYGMFSRGRSQMYVPYTTIHIDIHKMCVDITVYTV